VGPLGRSHPRVNGLLCRCSGEPTCQILPQQTHPRFLHDRRGADSSPEILAPSRADFSLPLGYKIRALVTRSLLSCRHRASAFSHKPRRHCESEGRAGRDAIGGSAAAPAHRIGLGASRERGRGTRGRGGDRESQDFVAVDSVPPSVRDSLAPEISARRFTV
jgi:hypothetical protein